MGDNQVRTDFDDDADGDIDRSETSTLDPDGNQVRTDFDDAADGNIDRVEFDDDADGTADRSEIFTYDENGNLIRTDFDDNNDGTINRADFDDNIPSFTSATTVSVAENQTAAYTAEATDADGDPLSYCLSGTDAALFTINPDTGVVRFSVAPDFENPGDDNDDNIYDIIVTASDGDNPTEQAVAITVTDENEVGNTPSFTSDAAVSVAENQTLAYTALATDADGDTLSYSLSGTDAAGFTIDPASGAVSFIAAPDFEAPGDADGDNIYDIIVAVSDADNRREQAVAITVTGENDNTPSFTSDAAAGVAENRIAAYTALATDADGDTLSYSLSGTDAALFTINPATGVVSFTAPPDFENPADAGGDNVYDIVVTASDGDNSTNHDVAITVTNVNDNDPTFSSGNSAAVAENLGVDNVVYTAMATDADGDPLSYSLSGTDAARFMIDPNTGAVRLIASPDFENPDDGGGNNVYDITVTASDGDNSTNQDVAITVTNVNDNDPTFSSGNSAAVAENLGVDNAVYMAMATDADGDPLSYSLSGTDAARFMIDPATGAVRFRAAPDFEAPSDAGGDNVYDIVVTASDGANSADQTVAVTVTDENEVGSAPVFTSGASAGVTENQTDAYTAQATDADGDTLTYTLSGTDAALFTINPAGEVSFMAAPDFEAPGDDDEDNIYDIIVTVSDGLNPVEQAVAITVTDLYEAIDLAMLDGTNGFTLGGKGESDLSGYSVSSAGDVNGDGYDDVIIGAWRADPGGRDTAGETYVVYGGATGTDLTLNRSTLDGTNGFTLVGIDSSDFSGRSVSSAGDVNGDGYDDLIIGAYRADPNGDSSGETYVVYGGASAPGTGGLLNLAALNGASSFVLRGVNAGDRAGNAVSSAGDVNGDGYDDLIIGAYRGDPNGSNSGEAYVVYGGATLTGGALLSMLDGANGFILNGIDADDNTGRSVSSAGDVNGDGYDDLIIGAWQADPNGDSSGETYVVYGGAAVTGGALDLSMLDGTNGFILAGIDEDDFSGRSVSSAGDVNGDGYDDLIISASMADANGENSGEAYVIYGVASAPGTNGALELSMLSGADGLILSGADDGDNTSHSVSSAGDVNGDGYDDLLIGAIGGDPGGVNAAGETHVVYGGATGTESTVPVTAQGTAAADNFTGNGGADSFTGIATDDVVRGGAGDDSISVTSLDFADIDGGAGRDSLVLNGSNLSLDLRSPGNAGLDSVEVFDLSGGGNTLVLDALAVFDLTEEREGGVATLDVLGDANDTVDLRDGNFTVHSTETEDGTTYTVYRDGNAEVRVETGVQVQTPVRAIDLSILDGSNGFTLNGIDMRDYSGISVSSAGDVNGDGYDDLIIGASSGDPNGAGSGESYVVYGGASAPGVLNLSTLDGANGFILNGIDAEDFSGRTVSSAGDVNGDGYDDLIIGAYSANPNGDGSGETYLVYGGPNAPGTDGVLDLSALDGANGFIVNGIDADDRSGFSVSSAGDINGDGYDDLIIGADMADPNGESSGEAYVVYGGATAAAGMVNLSVLNGANGFTLRGINEDERFGFSVSSAGDVNGDGYDDLIIGANRADSEDSPGGVQSEAGATYVVYGGARAPGTNGVLELATLDGTNGFALAGIDADDRSGRAVSSAGGVNGDGYDDLIIGADAGDPGGVNSAGETYLVYGGAGAPGTAGVLALSSLNGTNGLVLNGIDASDRSGTSVSSAGDVNGDGYDDLIIGADGATRGEMRPARPM